MEFLPWAFAAVVLVAALVNAYLVRKDARAQVEMLRADAKESIAALGAQMKQEWERHEAEKIPLRQQIIEQNRLLAGIKMAKGVRAPASQLARRIPMNGAGAPAETMTMARDGMDD